MPLPTLLGEIQFLRRKSYTRYEIDLDLLRRGYDPLEIEAAWYRINLPTARPIKFTSNPRFWLVLVLYVAGLSALYFLLNLGFPGTGAGFMVIFSLGVISSVSAKFLEKWDKAISRGLLYGAVVVFGCGMNVILFLGFYNILLVLSYCKGGCYP